MIRLSIPDIGEEEMNEIEAVLESKYLVQGKRVEKLEDLISEYLSIESCIAVSSGTAALHLALIALDIKAGDEVIIPDYTFPATSNVVEFMGAKSKFVDIKLQDFCIDESKIEQSITKRTKAIIVVHEFGQSAHMDRIMDIARRHKLKVIEDAACALGTEYKNTKVGTIGDIGCFSFHARKIITTGEGGVLVTRNNELFDKLRSIRNHGISHLKGKTEFVYAGLNYRMTDIEAALGIAQIKKIQGIIEYRRGMAKKYEKLFKDFEPVVIPMENPYCRHIYQTYHILLKDNIDRDSVIKKLKEKGIETSIGAYAVHKQLYYRKKYRNNDKKYPNALFAYTKGLAIPLHCKLDDKKIKFISDTIKDACISMIN